MLLESLPKTAIKKRYKSVDFIKDCALNYNLLAKNLACDNVSGFIKTTLSLPPSVQIVRAYGVKDNVYVYCNDKKLYHCKIRDYEVVEGGSFTSEPVVFEVVCNGSSKTLVASYKSGFIIDNNSLSFDFPIQPNSAVMFNRIFSVLDRVIYYSDSFNDALSKSEMKMHMLLQTPEELGEICGLGHIDNVIYVVCKKGILRIDEWNNQRLMSAKQIKTQVLDCMYRGVQSVDKAVFFVSNRVLYKITDGQVQAFDVFAHVKENVTFLLPSILNEYLILGLGKAAFGFNCALIFNSLTNEYYFTNSFEYMARNSGYSIDGTNRKIYLFSKKNIEKDCVNLWESLNLAFNSSKLKGVTAIEVYTAGKTKLEILGDFGTREFNLNKGYNYIKCNLLSKEFKIKLQGNPFSPPFSGLKIEYNIKGD